MIVFLASSNFILIISRNNNFICFKCRNALSSSIHPTFFSAFKAFIAIPRIHTCRTFPLQVIRKLLLKRIFMLYNIYLYLDFFYSFFPSDRSSIAFTFSINFLINFYLGECHLTNYWPLCNYLKVKHLYRLLTNIFIHIRKFTITLVYFFFVHLNW